MTNINRRRARPANGIVLWEGESLYDGAPIAIIVTGIISPSRNVKVGPSMQVWIVRTDIDPVQAKQAGYDGSICGDCAMRDGACYVVVVNGVLQVYRTYKAGKYLSLPETDVLEEIGLSRWFLRGGAYGNHSAAPFEVTQQLIEAGGHNGWCLYVHDWETCDQRFRHVAMASCETVEQAIKADRMGWRYYLAILEEESEQALDALAAAGVKPSRCPHRADDPRTPLCVDCRLCDGKRDDNDKRAHLWNPVHGSPHAMQSFRRMRTSLPVLAA